MPGFFSSQVYGTKHTRQFSCLAQQTMPLVLVINFKMPTIVGILKVMTGTNPKLLLTMKTILIFNRLAKERAAQLVALLSVVTVYVLGLFLEVPWVGMQSLIVTFPDTDAIKLFSCSTQLSMELQMLIKSNLL